MDSAKTTPPLINVLRKDMSTINSRSTRAKEEEEEEEEEEEAYSMIL
jgi:lipopolysaccharide/colanic/teichoic acid biosynthesis glycosyltransferase